MKVIRYVQINRFSRKKVLRSKTRKRVVRRKDISSLLPSNRFLPRLTMFADISHVCIVLRQLFRPHKVPWDLKNDK